MTDDITDECNKESHQNTSLKSTINTPGTNDSNILETFKNYKTSNNGANAITHWKSTKQKSTNCKPMNLSWWREFLMIGFLTSKKSRKRAENIPEENY